MSYGAHYYHIPLDPHYWSTQLTADMYNYCKVEGFHRFVRKKTFKNFFSKCIIQEH